MNLDTKIIAVFCRSDDALKSLFKHKDPGGVDANDAASSRRRSAAIPDQLAGLNPQFRQRGVEMGFSMIRPSRKEWRGSQSNRRSPTCTVQLPPC